MSTDNSDHVKKEGAWKAVHEAFNTEVPEHLENQLQNSLNAFRQDMREHPYVRRLERHGFPLKRNLIFFSRSWIRPLLWAGMGLAIVVIVGFFILGNNPPTWAQVQERFRSMGFFAVSIYKRNITHSGNPLIEPKLVQVWSGYGDRMRIRSGSKVTFVYQGEIVNTFDLTTRSEAYADGDTYDIVNTVGKSYTNAFDSLLMPFRSDIVPESISKEWKYGQLVDTTALVISDPMASKDLVVFDHEFFYLKSKSWRTRVWVLRKSRLPIRVLIWPRVELNGPLTRSPKWDMIITYSKEQPKEFFDSEAFAAKLKDPAISVDGLLYMFHQYPGGDSLPMN
jgi:outer membrane lipoprotein-sorting protein